MGVIICENHGRQKIVFLSKKLLSTFRQQKIEKLIYKIIIDYDIGFKEVFFMDEQTFNEMENKEVSLKLISEEEEVKPVCLFCFQDYLKLSQVKDFTISANWPSRTTTEEE